MKVKARVNVSGIVQGVGFRPFVYRLALELGLKGYVRNLGDAGVEIVVEGEQSSIERFVKLLKERKPSTARIDELTVSYSTDLENFGSFEIVRSSEELKGEFFSIPPDVGICEECVREMRDPSSRWYRYPFTACAVCGPRFTVMFSVPYDRENTSMGFFPMCEHCYREYHYDVRNRRFHTEGICCSLCGPRTFLVDPGGELVEAKNPIAEAAKLLREGYILAVKGIGGFHLAAITTEDEPIRKLRERKRRPYQPFAIMSPSLEEVERFAVVSDAERAWLTSPQRPIVLLQKKEPFPLSELIAPGLHNVGVMLAYTGLHLLLLEESKQPALIMTSGNRRGSPIAKDNEEALKSLRGIADYFLLHNRIIVNRCDDSVLRVNDGTTVLIRRSRGFAIDRVRLPSFVKDRGERNVLALGAMLQNTISLVKGGSSLFTSQYIGDVENLETYRYLEETVDKLLALTKTRNVDVVACDLHPGFLTTRLAEELSRACEAKLVRVQHHHAHAATTMLEYSVPPDERVLAVVVDGYGYGDDGNAWGGEFLLATYSSYERVGYLAPAPFIGGDRNTLFPARMAVSYLSKFLGRSELLQFVEKAKLAKASGLRELEIRALIDALYRSDNPPLVTTSLGRLLDAFSSLLGICYRRTYEGEPAIRLESVAWRSKNDFDIFDVPLRKVGGKIVLDTSSLFEEVYSKLNDVKKQRLASSILHSLGLALGSAAAELAELHGAEKVLLSGGAAANYFILTDVKRVVEERGLTFLFGQSYPPGDGGISAGQTMVALFST